MEADGAFERAKDPALACGRKGTLKTKYQQTSRLSPVCPPFIEPAHPPTSMAWRSVLS